MTTTRRTTKLTAAKPRGYVAIEVRFAGETQRIACVAKVDMTIAGTNGASVDLRAGEAYTLVRSESLSKQLGKTMFYIVRQVSGAKKCSCPAMKPCRHEISEAAHIAEHGLSSLHLRAHQCQADASKAAAHIAAEPAMVGSVAEHINVWQGLDDVALSVEEEAESQRITAANKAAEETAMRRFAEQQRLQAEAMRREAAPLNGNRGFSLLKV